MYPISDSPQQSTATICLEYQVRELLLFGSAARADFQPSTGDIDLLVEFEPETSVGWFRFSERQERLANLFACWRRLFHSTHMQRDERA